MSIPPTPPPPQKIINKTTTVTAIGEILIYIHKNKQSGRNQNQKLIYHCFVKSNLLTRLLYYTFHPSLDPFYIWYTFTSLVFSVLYILSSNSSNCIIHTLCINEYIMYVYYRHETYYNMLFIFYSCNLLSYKFKWPLLVTIRTIKKPNWRNDKKELQKNANCVYGSLQGIYLWYQLKY